jgi:hypothetical protein
VYRSFAARFGRVFDIFNHLLSWAGNCFRLCEEGALLNGEFAALFGLLTALKGEDEDEDEDEPSLSACLTNRRCLALDS